MWCWLGLSIQSLLRCQLYMSGVRVYSFLAGAGQFLNARNFRIFVTTVCYNQVMYQMWQREIFSAFQFLLLATVLPLLVLLFM